MRVLALVLVLMVAAAPSAAADGTTDILPDGVTTFVISAAGSYVMVENVAMTTGGVAITITSDNVTLDLNGHTITGAPGNNFSAITGANNDHIEIINGRITGFGQRGITLRNNAVVRNCRIFGNNKNGGSGGLSVGVDSIVERCEITGNTPSSPGVSTALTALAGSRIADNIVSDNDSLNGFAAGINAGASCIIINNVVRGQTGVTSGTCVGIGAGLRSVIRGNTVTDNDNLGTGDTVGIAGLSGCLIESNTCSDHSTGPTGTGIAIGISGGACTIINNVCLGNAAPADSNGTGIGISAGSGSVVRGNECDANNGKGTGFSVGIVGTAGNRIVENHCRNNIGGAGAWGIRMTNTANLVAGNSTQSNGTAGAIFLTQTSNRAHSNQFRENVGFDLTTGMLPISEGTGVLANVVF